MDDTQTTRVSDAAATRKRRSSILKSQRPPRTPFSELEFNVATPTDTAKSRRVSFSRRMGVAEFATNEGTTTWNFYEKHNKSLESSGNDSGAHAARPSIGHIGKRIFDQQFEEVEAVDFGGDIIPGNSRAADFNISINNVNLTQQLAALECTVDDKKLAAPQQNFDLMSITDQQSKLFGDDLSMPVMDDMSNQINVNFSMMNPMRNASDKCDDLDEIQRDLERSQHNVVCAGPFRARRSMSEYIEVDLNMTSVGVRNDVSDMSITDTVHSPKVQDVSKSNVSVNKHKKSIVDDDWAVDKENIAVTNPYIAPRESDNFAINEVPDQVLVFDGKKLTIQTERAEIPVISKDKGNYRNTLLPNEPVVETPQRKTIVLNINDDLPNFIEDASMLPHSQGFSSVSQEMKQSVVFNDGDLSLTQAVIGQVDVPSMQKTINYDNTIGNISITQAIPANIIIEDKTKTEKRRTILYENDNGNISMTQAVPANVLFENKPETQNKRRTTVYDNQNISITQAVPANLILPDLDKPSNRTILYHNNADDISFTQALPNNIKLLEKSVVDKSMLLEKSIGMGNISMTQVLPSNIILSNTENVPNKRRTIVFENDAGNISVTQAIPRSIIIDKPQEIENRRKTIVYDNDEGNISMTQVLPAKILQEVLVKTNVDNAKSNLVAVESEKASDNNVNLPENNKSYTVLNVSKTDTKKRLTIMYDDVDISMTQALPPNILSVKQIPKPDKRKTVVFEDEAANISMTQALPSNILFKEEKILAETLHFQNQDISTTRIVSSITRLEVKSTIIDNDKSKVNDVSLVDITHNASRNLKRDTINKDNTLYGGDISNLSMTKPIPNNILEVDNEISKADIEKFGNLTQFSERTLLQESLHDRINSDVIVYQATTHDASKLQLNKIDTESSELDTESNKSIVSKDTNTSSKSLKTNENLISDDMDIDYYEKDAKVQIELEEKDTHKAIEYNAVISTSSVVEAKGSKSSQGSKKKSILHELLDMTSSSVEEDTADQEITANSEAKLVEENVIKDTENKSSDKFLTIANDIPTDNKVESPDNHTKGDLPTIVKEKEDTVDVIDNANVLVNSNKLEKIENKSFAAVENKTEIIEIPNNFENKVVELRQSFIKEKKSPPPNRHFEKIVSSDLQNCIEEEKVINKSNINDSHITKSRKSFKEADDTKELLEMLSDFTDRRSCAPIEEEEDKAASPIKLRSSLTVENKTEIHEPRRLSFAPNRQSIVLSREDLLNNISMAQAALQQSRFEIDDSGSIEDTANESPTEINESIESPMKSVRMSTEVVKTLHFEDESCSDASLKTDMKISPLKKTAFGETTYMKETKANVIPTYLKDVSDNIKALMSDLVKPRPDQMPFESIGMSGTKKAPSTCSTQIQANLVTSSQIDLETELHSNVNSAYNLNNADSLVTEIADMGNRAMDHALKGPVNAVSVEVSEMEVVNEAHAPNMQANFRLKKQADGPVLLFDHNNPLNNVLLAPLDCTEVHKYNPSKSSDTLCEENAADASEKKGHNFEVERVSTQYNVESRVGLQSGDACAEKKGDSRSLCSDPSKPLSIDRSTDGCALEVKDTEVNTLIVMKGNKELLEASSSLTLVDDALNQSVFDIKVETRPSEVKNSPVKVIYKIDDEDASMLENIDSDFVSNDDEPVEYVKAKKRSYSPTQRDTSKPATLSSPDVTPKPISKMQKMSNSPNVYKTSDVRRLSPEKPNNTTSEDSNTEIADVKETKKKSPRKSKGSPKHKRPGTDVTVQQLITEFKITKMEQDMIEEQIMEAIHDRMSASSGTIPPDTINTGDNSPDVVTSCTSSKGQSEMLEAQSVKESVSYVGSQPSRVDWQPELAKETSSRNLVTECESSVNVVAKIDMLPFMGRECEWETSGGDTWVFRLLRSRLRLRVKLAHRHHNALRSRVRADTPVLEACVETVQAEEKDPLACLCVRFAAEAMRYECSRGGGAGADGGSDAVVGAGGGGARAGAVPALLRRCAGVARVALRWARAMRDARARLAYTLTPDGELALKVANIPLRSVWEVRMRLELVVEDAREAAWPRAGGVRVARVVADCAVPPAEARRALAATPRDWGHAPRTLWKIFRYLKNKTREDDFLGL